MDKTTNNTSLSISGLGQLAAWVACGAVAAVAIKKTGELKAAWIMAFAVAVSLPVLTFEKQKEKKDE